MLGKAGLCNAPSAASPEGVSITRVVFSAGQVRRGQRLQTVGPIQPTAVLCVACALCGVCAVVVVF